MEDGTRNERHDRPQQKLYRPGSGPLRKTSPGSDSVMESCKLDSVIPPPGPRGRGHFKFRNKAERENYSEEFKRGSLRSVNEDDSDFRRLGRKPERAIYSIRPGGSNSDSSHVSRDGFRGVNSHSSKSSIVLSNDHNFNRNHRQASEPRSTSPQYNDDSSNYRNRDTRSMETSVTRNINMGGHGSKPPSGRRYSSGPVDSGKPKYTFSIDNLPPRFQKMYLAESGQLSLDSNINNSNQSGHRSPLRTSRPPINVWSQTLPSRGRGRMKDIELEREKYMSAYSKYDTEGSRHSTPSGSRSNLYDSSDYDDYSKLRQDGKKNSVVKSEDDQQKSIKITNSTQNSNAHRNNQTMQNHTNEDNDTMTSLTNAFSNLTNLDWNAELEKSMKMDDNIEVTPSFLSSSTSKPSQENKKPERRNKQKSRRQQSGSKKRSAGNRSISRENRRDKSIDKASNVTGPLRQETLHRDSGSESIGSGWHRERRDSHRSNRSSIMGSRDDLDRWRSLRSFSREHTPERRIISQCNSRDPSGNRAGSPRDLDGFRVPQTAPNNGRSSRNQRRNSRSSSGWRSSDRGGRVSPAPPPPPLPAAGGAPPTPGRPEGEHVKPKKKKSGRSRGEKNRNRSPQRTKSPATTSAATSSGVVNWREEIKELKRSRERAQDSGKKTEVSQPVTEKAKEVPNVNSHPGILLLPQPTPSHIINDTSSRPSQVQTKTLFDPQNPSKPIVVQTTSNAGADSRNERLDWAELSAPGAGGGVPEGPRPSCYDELSDTHRAARNRDLLLDTEVADTQLQQHCSAGALAVLNNWQHIMETRRFLQNVLQRLLISDLKFCSVENIEHHFWRILYYKFIEVLRKHLTQESEEKERVLALINNIIDEGNKYFESLVELLEKAYKFKVEDYLNGPHLTLPKGLGYIGLGLHSVQKMYLFLGDLARYKEQVNDSSNYGKSKFWYTKAQQINPKNGRPYNQLAILAIYSRRKLDAVYYYMRSLMSSNPFHSARESLIALFDENRKKYESAERKRRAAREAARAAANGDAGARGPGVAGGGGTRGLRREVWVRPGGGRTTTLCTDDHRDEDELANMSCVELNKNFITSYLHVHGKLITKIGMESLHESASLMLRQFRALLRQQPLPTTSNRLLQLVALNMFAIENSINKESGAAWSECALGVALLMFGMLLERCCSLLLEPPGTQPHSDALLVLPAIKVWCDWMLCHSSVWNPPPSLDRFKLGTDADPWEWLAKLMNILEEQDDKSVVFESEPREGTEAVRLSEDATMAGFTPLMYMDIEPAFVSPDPAAAANLDHVLRARRLLFFGTEYLVGVEPPALRLHCPAGEAPRYVSAVRPPPPPPEDEPLQDVSEDEETEDSNKTVSEAAPVPPPPESAESDEATRRLLRRKEMLEARRLNMERRRKRMQEILRGSWVSVELEVRPRWLVPDTNCFIDHLPLLQRVAHATQHPYVLAVPLVVVRELEGLSRCARVGEAARAALAWLGTGAPGLRFATTRGSLLASAAFTAESGEQHASNDDRVLAAALGIHQTHTEEQTRTEGEGSAGSAGGARRLVREVVLLTDDRNLRVKALAAELPARDLPAFVQWAAVQPSAHAPSLK